MRDATGLPVAGATVTLALPAGPALTSTTTNRGEAVFDRLAPGAYHARIETLGFAQGQGGGRAANIPRLEIFARGTNVLTAVNPQRFGSVLTSPFFGPSDVRRSRAARQRRCAPDVLNHAGFADFSVV